MGLCVSLAALYIKGWRSKATLLGSVVGTDLYVDLSTHKQAVELQSIKIFRYIGAINFASRGSFKKELYATIQLNNQVLSSAAQLGNGEEERSKLITMRTLILDLSAVTHMDVAACKTCNEIKRDLDLFGAQLMLTCPNDRVLDAIKHAEFLGEGKFEVFPSVHDAVLLAKLRNVDEDDFV